jgi:hypothetical protein
MHSCHQQLIRCPLCYINSLFYYSFVFGLTTLVHILIAKGTDIDSSVCPSTVTKSKLCEIIA